jgi:hypothetical protein
MARREVETSGKVMLDELVVSSHATADAPTKWVNVAGMVIGLATYPWLSTRRVARPESAPAS